MVTIDEIARRANVSKTTVSRVLNGRPDVDARTAQRVQAVVAELGYVPSANARALAHGRGRSVGLLVPTLDLAWLQEVLRGIADEVEAADHTLALHTLARGRESVAAFSAQVAARVVDGLVAVIPHGYEDDLLALARHGLPIVLIDDSGHHDLFPSVWSTDRAGGRQATAHLLALGRRPVATVTGPLPSFGAQERLAGYRAALREVGVAEEPDLIAEGDWTHQGGERAMAALLAARPDLGGVFAANDLMAFGAVRTLARAGRRVPRDVAVVGYDDIPFAALATPALTTVRQPLYGVGRRAARLVLDALAGSALPLRAHVMNTTLIVRESCGAPVDGAPPGNDGREVMPDLATPLIRTSRDTPQ